jgi:hypothetical protein
LATIKKNDLKDFCRKNAPKWPDFEEMFFLRLPYFDIRFEAPAGGQNIARFFKFSLLSSLNCSQI